jgi:NAD(P)H-quinone oxidoreductase subunit 4
MNTADFPWLTTVILLPIVAALLIPLVPDKGDGKTVRWYALIVGLIDFVITTYAFATQYDLSDPGMQLFESYAWVPSLDLNWSVGADGLSMPLILLTSFITTLAILASWPVTLKPKLFYFLMLAMYGGQIGVFAVQDVGTRVDPGLPAAVNLGRQEAHVCSHKVYFVYRRWIAVYSGGGLSDGILWRHGHV